MLRIVKHNSEAQLFLDDKCSLKRIDDLFFFYINWSIEDIDNI